MRGAFFFFVFFSAASAVFAHGGEDHGTPPPAPTSDSGSRAAAASTSTLELVARWPAAPAGSPLLLRVLLSHFESNAPVESATVTVDVTDPTGASLPSLTLGAASPGIYEGTLTVTHDGVHAAAVTVVAGELVDVVAIAALPFGPPAPGEASPHDHDHDRSPLLLVVLIVVLLGAAIAAVALFLLLRRRRVTVASALLLALLAGPARAHGGEDHGAPAAATAAGSADTVLLPKESQFLLGIRTVKVTTAPVTDRLVVPGVVTAPPERHAAIFSPQQARVVGGRGLPLLGARVKRGQVLAVLEAALDVGERASFAVQGAEADTEVAAARARLAAAEKNVARVGSLEGVVSQRDREAAAVEQKEADAALRAAEAKQAAYGSAERATRIVLESPIEGIVADVDVSPGELVEPGRRAFLIVDPTELWVEARIYEADLARLGSSAGANITVDAWPDDVFAASLLATGEVVDPATRTVKALFRVDNTARRLKLGMFARVEIGAGGAHDALVVPQQAVLDVDGRSVVFVHTTPEQWQRREVVLGRRDGALVEVKGVSAGERVAVSGLLTLKNAPAAPAPSPSPAPSPRGPKAGGAAP